MENKEVEIIEINGMEYAIVEELGEYVYAVNTQNNSDVKILTSKEDPNRLRVLNEEETSVALDRFYEQYSYLAS